MEIVLSLVGLVAFFWCLARTWKGSILLAILSFFFWPLLLIPLFKNWGEEDDIKIPFAVFIFGMGTSLYLSFKRATAVDPESMLQALTLFA